MRRSCRFPRSSTPSEPATFLLTLPAPAIDCLSFPRRPADTPLPQVRLSNLWLSAISFLGCCPPKRHKQPRMLSTGFRLVPMLSYLPELPVLTGQRARYTPGLPREDPCRFGKTPTGLREKARSAQSRLLASYMQDSVGLCRRFLQYIDGLFCRENEQVNLSPPCFELYFLHDRQSTPTGPDH